MAIYGLRIEDMEASEMMSLAWRVAAYPGIMRARAMAALQQSETGPETMPDLFEITEV